MIRSESIQRWWPTTQSLDIVEGNVDSVASALRTEVGRFIGNENLTESWESFINLDEAFSSATEFANVPTLYLVLPTKSRWVVLWNNSYLCDGYDSLCWCLNRNHHFTTLHWAAHDETTTFQPGAAFTHRAWREAIVERSVYVGCNDGRWSFKQDGIPLREEDVELYQKKQIRDRLNEHIMANMLKRFGAMPWSEEFYDFEKSSFVVRRKSVPTTVLRRQPAEVLRGAG